MSDAVKECTISDSPAINAQIMSMPYEECRKSFLLNSDNCGLAARVEWMGILIDKAMDEGIKL